MIEIFQEFEKFRDVKYFDKDHTYTIKGQEGLGVSKLISKFKQPFNGDFHASKKAIQRGVSKETILQEWDYKKELACEKGHIFHEFCENYEANKIKPLEKNITYTELYKELPPLEDMFIRFKEDTKGKLIPIASELVVGDYGYNLCGTIDKIYYNVKYKCLQIFDWKTNSKFNFNNKFQKYKRPLSHLEECEYNTYSFQLSAYRWILEQNTNLKFGDSYAIWFSLQNPSYRVIKMLDLRKEVEEALEWNLNHGN